MRWLALLIGLALLVLAAGCSSPSSFSPSGFLSGMAGHDQVRVVQTAVAVLPDTVAVRATEEPRMVLGPKNSSLELTISEDRPERSRSTPLAMSLLLTLTPGL